MTGYRCFHLFDDGRYETTIYKLNLSHDRLISLLQAIKLDYDEKHHFLYLHGFNSSGAARKHISSLIFESALP